MRPSGLVWRKIKLKNFYDPKTAGGCGVVRFWSAKDFLAMLWRASALLGARSALRVALTAWKAGTRQSATSCAWQSLYVMIFLLDFGTSHSMLNLSIRTKSSPINRILVKKHQVIILKIPCFSWTWSALNFHISYRYTLERIETLWRGQECSFQVQ